MQSLEARMEDRAKRAQGTADEGNVNTNNEVGAKAAEGWGDTATNGKAQRDNLSGNGDNSGFQIVGDEKPAKGFTAKQTEEKK